MSLSNAMTSTKNTELPMDIATKLLYDAPYFLLTLCRWCKNSRLMQEIRLDKTENIELTTTAEQITRNDGGRPYLRMLSTNTHTAQKCIQELNTCTEIITIDQTRYCSLSPFKWLAFTLDRQAYHNLLGGLLIKKDKKRKRRRDSPCSNRACNPQYSSHVY